MVQLVTAYLGILFIGDSFIIMRNILFLNTLLHIFLIFIGQNRLRISSHTFDNFLTYDIFPITLRTLITTRRRIATSSEIEILING